MTTGARPTHASPPSQPIDALPGIGHNSGNARIDVELRTFNRIRTLVGDGLIRRHVDVPAGTTVGELLERQAIPVREVFIAFVNGRDISTAPGALRLEHVLDAGDVVALSGPIPYSWGYGAPVV